MNFLEERRQSPAETERRRQELSNRKELIFLASLIAALASSLIVVGVVVQSKWFHLLTSLSCLALILPTFSVLLRPDIAAVNCFFVLQTATSISIRGATFYFFTDSQTQYPGGPH